MIYFNLEFLLVKHQTFKRQVGNLSLVSVPNFSSPPKSNTKAYICMIVNEKKSQFLMLLLSCLQLAQLDKQATSTSDMDNELVNQSGDHNQQEEQSDHRKESSHLSSRRRSSPSGRPRNYRKRSVSESPEKSPQRRSPENSPSSRKRSRRSDPRGNIICLPDVNLSCSA